MTGYPAWLDAYLDWEHRSRGQIHNYLDAFFSTARYPITPYAVIALAWNPYLDGGKVRWRHRKEMSFAWPAERAQLIDTIMAAAPYADVGVCPYLMKDRHRRKGNSLTRHSAHADIDEGFDERMEQGVRDLPGGCAVGSGQPEHAHVYSLMAEHGSEVLDLPNHEHLCRVLGKWFHATDPKISDNDMMRMPGTWNFKPRAYDPDAAPLPVTWVVGPPEDRPDAIRLRRYLGTRKVGPGYSGTSGGAHGGGPGCLAETEPVDLTWHLGVKAALKQRTPSRRPVQGHRPVCGHPPHRGCLRGCRPDPAADPVGDQPARGPARADRGALRRRRRQVLRQDHRGPRREAQGRSYGWRRPGRPAGGSRAADGHAERVAVLRSQRRVSRPRSCERGDGVGHMRIRLPRPTLLHLRQRRLAARRRTASRAEITRLLGNRYRSAHTRTVLDLIQHSPSTAHITDNPLAEYVNVPNGMVAWKTGDLLPHSPDYRSTVQLPVEYDPNAKCPLFEKFIAEVLPPDLYEPTGDSPGFIWELIGYTLYSGNPLHVAVLLYGKGRNGKGTLIRVLKALLGERNCSTVGLHQLVENRFRAATLFGKLANLAGDLDSKWLDNTAMFKAITGGDTIQAEHKYGAAFDFSPWALPFYSTNKAFGSADSSEGWVARWVVVPFPTSFMGREDRTLDAKLQLRRRVSRHPAPRHRSAAGADGTRPVHRAAVAAGGQDRVRGRVRRGAGLAGRVLRARPRRVDPAQGPLRRLPQPRLQRRPEGARRARVLQPDGADQRRPRRYPAGRTRGFAGVRRRGGAAQGAGAQAQKAQAGA